MIFQLKQVKGGIDNIVEVPLVFLENAITQSICSENLLPIWFRKVYDKCPGVREKFENLFAAFKKLNKTEKRKLINAYRKGKDIQKVCSQLSFEYEGLEKYNSKIGIPLKELFEFLFNNTIGTKIFKQVSKMSIDDHYEKFHTINNVDICPFCGLEPYTLPKFRRAEYDHYLPISIYPWLGVNFNNLVPMGDICNGKKNDTNLLYVDKKFKTRRTVWYPYEWFDYSMTLNCIQKPNINDIGGEWEVKFSATSKTNDEKLNTWCDVFEIPFQFSEKIKIFHKRFIEDFAKKNNLYGHKLTLTKLKDELINYSQYGIGDERIENMAKLKFIWANYYINTKDQSQLIFITHTIINLKQRPNI